MKQNPGYDGRAQTVITQRRVAEMLATARLRRRQRNRRDAIKITAVILFTVAITLGSLFLFGAFFPGALG